MKKKAPTRHLVLYEKFLKSINNPKTLFHPRARGLRRKLVPPPGKYPCDLCHHANFNKLCSESIRCAAFIYYQFSILERLPE